MNPIIGVLLGFIAGFIACLTIPTAFLYCAETRERLENQLRKTEERERKKEKS